jgi:hypothetical protein
VSSPLYEVVGGKDLFSFNVFSCYRSVLHRVSWTQTNILRTRIQIIIFRSVLFPVLPCSHPLFNTPEADLEGACGACAYFRSTCFRVTGPFFIVFRGHKQIYSVQGNKLLFFVQFYFPFFRAHTPCLTPQRRI